MKKLVLATAAALSMGLAASSASAWSGYGYGSSWSGGGYGSGWGGCYTSCVTYCCKPRIQQYYYNPCNSGCGNRWPYYTGYSGGYNSGWSNYGGLGSYGGYGSYGYRGLYSGW